MKAKLFFMFCVVFQLVSAQNQNKNIADFGEGSFSTFKNSGKLEKVSKLWPIQIQKGTRLDAEGNTMIPQVIVSKMGIIKETFTPDIAENPVYFGLRDFRITAINDKLYYYTYTPGKAEILFILTKNGSVSSLENEKQTLESFIKDAFKNQQSTKGQLADIQKANEEKLLAESSLKGKDIKKIEIVLKDVPQELGMRSIIKFGLKATSSDGKMYSTPNLGGYTPWSDFDVKTSEGVYTDDQIQVNDDAKTLTNDALTFKVSSKYHPAISATETIALNYAFKKIDLNFIGTNGLEINWRQAGVLQEFNYKGQNGASLDIKAQKATSKNKNAAIYKIEIINVSNGKVLERFKISENTVVNVNISGIYGRDGNNSFKNEAKQAQNGSDGGNGGNATIYKSADAQNISLNVISNAGKGGAGGKGMSSFYNGSAGKDGKSGMITNKTLSGSLNW